MKKILLVDDDVFFRTMFSGMFPWREHGLALLQAGNGREAIGLLHKYHDIVLVFTDMNMPILDGVELVQYITEQCHNIPCIALSAYDDFSYVRSSLKNGADDYLLKHALNNAQLTQLITQYTADTPQKESVSRKSDELRDQFLYDYITGLYREVSDIEGLFAALYLPALTKNLLLMVLVGDGVDATLSFSNVRDTAQYQRTTACCMLQGLLDSVGTGAVFSGPDGLIYLLVTSEKFENLQFVRQTTKFLTSQAERMLLQYFNLHTHLFCAPLSRRGATLYESYHILIQDANLQAQEDICQSQVILPVPEFQQVLDELYFGTEDSLQSLVSHCYLLGRQQYVRQKCFSELTVSFLQIIAQAAEALHTTSVSLSAITVQADDAQEDYVIAELLKLYPAAAKAAAEQYAPLVYRALQLIHQNFQNCDLTPSDISKQLNVHPAYMSRLFKEGTQQNFSDYLCDTRMKHACYLLKASGHTVKDVAELCGYDNYSYFFKVFKKRLGVTPKEYRIQAISGRRC